MASIPLSLDTSRLSLDLWQLQTGKFRKPAPTTYQSGMFVLGSSSSRSLAAALAAASARLWPAGASLLPCAWPAVAAQLHTSSQAAVVSHRRPPPTPSGAPKHAEGRLMNADITSRTVRLVGEDGHELLTRAEALARLTLALGLCTWLTPSRT